MLTKGSDKFCISEWDAFFSLGHSGVELRGNSKLPEKYFDARIQ
jgi:hypothetical protein